MSPDFVEPPDDVRNFPASEFASALYRIHASDREPWFFGSTGEFRFDLTSQAGAGACYLATTSAGAFVEVFGDLRTVPEGLVRRKMLSRARPRDKLYLANTTDPKALGDFGLALEISAHLDYRPTQRWAAAFYRAGFDGILYAARHDPSGTSRSVAVFGSAPLDPDRLEWDDPHSISDLLLEEVSQTFGIEVLSSWP